MCSCVGLCVIPQVMDERIKGKRAFKSVGTAVLTMWGGAFSPCVQGGCVGNFSLLSPSSATYNDQARLLVHLGPPRPFSLDFWVCWFPCERFVSTFPSAAPPSPMMTALTSPVLQLRFVVTGLRTISALSWERAGGFWRLIHSGITLGVRIIGCVR